MRGKKARLLRQSVRERYPSYPAVKYKTLPKVGIDRRTGEKFHFNLSVLSPMCHRKIYKEAKKEYKRRASA